MLLLKLLSLKPTAKRQILITRLHTFRITLGKRIQLNIRSVLSWLSVAMFLNPACLSCVGIFMEKAASDVRQTNQDS